MHITISLAFLLAPLYWILLDMDAIIFFFLDHFYYLSHYYKMWAQFTIPHSLNQWIHYFFIGPYSLQPMNSFKIQWNHLAYRDTFWSNHTSHVFRISNQSVGISQDGLNGNVVFLCYCSGLLKQFDGIFAPHSKN